ncbi:uncharacterized protein LOC110450805 [Mizuhopecten yessoensis]|uniref:Regulator of G-protein signaling protein-like n=1 Tax=Mizuhopecten yessoensis TaxID=6573 RepID=A0A210QN14_MIZYE|nr:uncharacterized protein LOC110450805 [Mizuhopecten yessoensis]OWF50105.1 Regulator of G-protein signaling protein-like [Mizuhopecten yessoensis]
MELKNADSLSDADFSLLLEDRTFVDYFNVFNSLPIFGQHVLYNYIEKEFEYEPPIRNRNRFTNKREVLKWLIQERYRLFEQTSLFLEFRLNTKLRDIDFNPETSKLRDAIGEEVMARYIFGRNVVGSCMGMQIFREFLRNTMGEKIYKCWMDIEKWQHIPENDERKEHMKHYIKRNYIGEGGTDDLMSQAKYIVYQGKINFTLMSDKDVFDDIIHLALEGGKAYNADTDVAFQQLHKLLLAALRRYWVPRFLIHVIKVTSKDILVLLKRESPGDIGLLTLSRRQRHRITIRQIYSTNTSCASTPAPTPHDRSNPTTPRPKSIAESETFLPASETLGLNDGKIGDEADATKEEDNEKKDLKENEVSEEEEEEVEDEFEEESNIQPDDLLSLWGGKTCGTAEKYPPENQSSSSSVVHEDKGSNSSDTNGLKELESWQQSVESNYSFSGTDRIVNHPIFITSYLSGRSRMHTGSSPNISNRMLCALASDHLSGAPFRAFLKKKGLELDMRYLSFWSDVRHYLDTEDGNTDCYGTPLKQSLAKTITERYLSSSSSDTEIFSEGLKMTLFASLTQKHDVSLLCSAQDIVSGMLKEPWGMYMKEERKAFRKRVCGKKRTRHVVEVPSNSMGPPCQDGNDPIFFFNSAKSPGNAGSRPYSGDAEDSDDSRPSSTTTNMDHVCLSEEQVWKAFEITVLCNEYGRSGMVPQTEPRIHDLVDVLYSDYGSLNIRQEATVRQEALRELVFPPKIDIENVRVSRKVLLDDAKYSKENEDNPRYNRLVLRRNGILIERPVRPKTFMEVLNHPVHFDFFKRYMMSNKMAHTLQFWSAVEELKDTQGARGRQNMVLQIFKRFFSRGAKQGYLLDCSDDIIRQIPTMEKVPASVMICAQSCVFRSMERKWYPRYLETFPTDAEYRESMHESYPPNSTMQQLKELEQQKTGKPRRMRRKKTINLWHGFSNAILDFLRAMRDPTEVRLFEIFLKYETDRDHDGPSNAFEKSLMTSSTMDIQTRVVMRNRLVLLNKLGNDLLFWIEVGKYRKQVETLKTLENFSKSESDLLVAKAKAIIDSFIVSEILPRVQINIPNELGHSIAHSLNSSGPVRGLFHDATILLFPILYYFWKRFHESWLANANPEDVLPKLEAQIRPKRVLTPHKDKELPNLFNIRYSTVDVTQQNVYGPDDERVKITFSMVNGVKLVYPLIRGQKTGLDKHSTTNMSKRVVKQSHLSVSNMKKNTGESKTKLQKQSLADARETSPKTQRTAFKIPVKILTPQQERAKKLSLLVEELNKHSSGKSKKTAKPLSSFTAVVSAALSLRNKENPFAEIDE